MRKTYFKNWIGLRKRRLFIVTVTVMIVSFFAAASAVYGKINVTDEGISDSVEDELLLDSAIPNYLIDVSTIEGVVTLSGTADSILEKDRAAEIAGIVKGVRSVVNNIKVVPPFERTDDQILSGVKEALLNDPATDSYEIDVSVSKNVVTLEGKVDSWQEKDLCEIVAKGVKGVKKVKNDITLEWPEKRTDYEIKADIEQALKWDTLIDHALIDVKVDNAKVTLTGIAGSAAEKDRAFWKSFVMGVKSVDKSGLEVKRWARDEDLRGKKYVSKSESEIKDAVNDALLYDPRVFSFKVTPEVDGSRVTLRGTVDNLKARRAAAQDARNTVGVRYVDNRIKVRPVETYSDEKIEKMARQALLRDPYVESYEITVSVANGVANLYGAVDSFFEKSQADDVVSKVNGVVFVDNNLMVQDDYDHYVYDPYVDKWYLYDYDWYHYSPFYTTKSDLRIEMDINDELFWSPFVDANDVEVDVNGGKATLTGTVNSWTEYNAAEDNAYEGGAVIVDNDLIVKTS